MSASASKKKRKELNEQGLSLTEIAEQKEKEKKMKSLRTTGLFALVVVVCLAGIIALLLYLQNRKYAPDYDVSKPAATVGEAAISVPVYNHFYNMSVNNLMNSYYSYFVQAGTPFSQQSLGDSTVEAQFINITNSNLEEIYNLYNEAKANGFELSEENNKSIQETIDNLEKEAETYGFNSVSKYMAARYGRGCTADSYKEFLTVYLTYAGYLSKLQEEFKPADAELTAKYDEDHAVYDFVTCTYATTNAEAEKKEDDDNSDPVYTQEAKDKAKEDAEALKEKLPDSATTITYQKANMVSSLNQEIADWLFDTARKEGDVAVFAKDDKNSIFYTVRFDSRDDNDYHLANAYIVSVTKDTKEVEEGQKTAEEKFNELYAAVTENMTDEEFSKKVTDLGFSTSSNSYARTTSIDGLADFLYDPARKAGDITKLENETTYYLVRFVSTEEDTYRNSLIKNTLWNDFYTNLSTKYKIQIDEEQIKHANTDLTLTSSSSNS